MTPALWITASIGPSRFTWAATSRVCARSDWSPTTTSAPRSSRSRTAARRLVLRAWITILCPSSSSVCAAASPRPSAEPVMKTRAIGVFRGALRRCCALVLLVSDVLAPGDRAAGLVVLLHGDVDHEAVRGGAVPVVLAGLEEDAVAGADDLDRAAFALAESGTLGDEDRLAVRVGVPGGSGAGGEVHRRGRERRGGLRCGDRVDVDVAGEPLGGPLLRFDVSC